MTYLFNTPTNLCTALLVFSLFCFVRLYCYAFVQYCNVKTMQSHGQIGQPSNSYSNQKLKRKRWHHRYSRTLRLCVTLWRAFGGHKKVTNIRRARKEGSLPSYPDLSSMKLKRSGYQNRDACHNLPSGLALHRIKWQDGKLKDNQPRLSLPRIALPNEAKTDGCVGD